MGGGDEDEPPSKRKKLSSGVLIGLSNGSSLTESVSGSLGETMARPLHSQGDDEMVGSKGVIKRVEFVRIIAKALYSLGYNKSGALLEEESGIPLHSSLINLFMQQILEGNWDESVRTLHEFCLLDENIIKLASSLILEQKYFELLDAENFMEALKTLRTDIAPLCINNSRLRELSSCILMSPSNGLLNGHPSLISDRKRSRSQLLEDLQKLFPATLMIPERRLENLVEQALSLQRDACPFHNPSDQEMSLYVDHQCGKDQIPTHTLQILQDHEDEVWCLQFSHNGKYLASSSKDLSAIVWQVNVNNQVSLKHKLSGHQKSVCYVSWSPNDSQLLTCGVEGTVRRWDVATGECLHVYEKTGLGLLSCGWSASGEKVFCGVTDKSISVWDLNGKELDVWKGKRTLLISDLEVSSDGKWIITMCGENVILLYNMETKAEEFLEETQTIISFSLSIDDKFLLVNLCNQEMHLWNLKGDVKSVAKYEGYKRTRLLIRSCLGGLEQGFIASGSEDSQVYIWHRDSMELIEVLPGHSGAVNCVSWNPVNPHMLASASDDRTIRIWGLKAQIPKQKSWNCHGNHYSNGHTKK
uniref:CTLH domain-containing protein n=1 Tax=Kalanchoe fedtschenkoi TaxID=63787 RepID=A0A7N0UAI3_KALFE